MRATLASWVSDAEVLRYLDQFRATEIPIQLNYQHGRKDDLYLALVGELFQRMRDNFNNPNDWARLGNAFALYLSDSGDELKSIGVSIEDIALFAAASFYFGGFPASAYLTMRNSLQAHNNDAAKACFDFLARPKHITSNLMNDLVTALRNGNLDAIAVYAMRVSHEEQTALQVGPDQWIPTRLLEKLISRFCDTNLRSVLPEGHSDFWTPLISSFLDRQPATWDFFPSQIQAIQSGLLQRTDTFSLQMPTGAGKTALCETLLFWHLKQRVEDVAVILVPYRSLASELRNTLIRRLNEMGISARCAYGGTVPSGDEVREFDNTRALVATPETLSGILSANQSFFRRISLVICDEGHLLDAPSRGVGLELLLARMKARDTGAPRFVFLSAIVPNIEEINAWLGGSDDSVVRSDYRPAIAEFSVLRSSGRNTSSLIDLEMHPHEEAPIRFKIENFLRHEDFTWLNPSTGKLNTYPFTSIKTLAIAAARKTLPMGTAVVFTANKRGNQGAIGLTEEILNQLTKSLRLPNPISYVNRETIDDIAAYLDLEYGDEWIGTRALKAGVIIHHGDIPQETREVFETALRQQLVKFGVCTNTLAEGINLPIRTLVLYSVQRIGEKGLRQNLLTRDIKNLVGRTGRAGATTKGLVICANEDQWPLINAVARQAIGEPVVGALTILINNVKRALAERRLDLTNELLERSVLVHSLIDGIDSTLVDLAAVELGDDTFLNIATQLAEQTFASQHIDGVSKTLLSDVFKLRARKIAELRTHGKLEWLTDTGTRVRMIDIVETGLMPLRQQWDDINDPLDTDFVNIILQWALDQVELEDAIRDAYRIGKTVPIDSVRESFINSVKFWLAGATFYDIARNVGLTIDDMLGLHAQVITFTLQTIIEQGISLLGKFLLTQEKILAAAVTQFPEHLRFGVPSSTGVLLSSGGVHHRRAYVELGALDELHGLSNKMLFIKAKKMIEQDLNGWQRKLGKLILDRTLNDLSKRKG